MIFLTRSGRRTLYTILGLVAVTFLILKSRSRFIAFRFPKKPPLATTVLFPKSFSAQDIEIVKKDPVLSAREYSKAEFITAVSPSPEKNAKYTEKSKHPLHVFHSDNPIGMDLDKCELILTDFTNIEVSEKRSTETPLKDIVLQIIRTIDSGYDDYITEISPYFNVHIRLQYIYDVYDRFWFRLAGSTVWLEQYGLHLMVSRLAYCPTGSRNNPKLSVLYAELFTPDWKPVKLSMVVPTNDGHNKKAFTHKEKVYTVVNYPTILPVPFHHIYEDDGKYFGPEDARMILVKNAGGFEEPLLVFNALHQKLEYVDDDEDHLVKQLVRHRSMWVCWPWQFQQGKGDIDGLEQETFAHTWYNRVKELVIKNVPRENQKNWTPMISDSLRSVHGYDKELLFVFRWSNLQILKCDLVSNEGCGFAFRMNDRLVISSKVGPLRGGTELININNLLRDSKGQDIVDQMIPRGREIWVGFARAHLVDCGCGKDIYRPNLVVLVKDTVGTEGSKKRSEVYNLSLVSSFMSLNVDIKPWNPSKPYELCGGTNALIPNGISKWNVKIEPKADGTFDIADEVVVSISISDSTLDAIHMRGLLKALFSNIPGTLSIKYSPEMIPSNDDDLLDFGHTNDNLVCAMAASEEFCRAYGKEMLLREKVMGGKDDMGFDIEVYDDKLEKYKAGLDEFGLY